MWGGAPARPIGGVEVGVTGAARGELWGGAARWVAASLRERGGRGRRRGRGELWGRAGRWVAASPRAGEELEVDVQRGRCGAVYDETADKEAVTHLPVTQWRKSGRLETNGRDQRPETRETDPVTSLTNSVGPTSYRPIFSLLLFHLSNPRRRNWRERKERRKRKNSESSPRKMASRSGRVYKHIEALGGFRSFRHYFSTGRLPKWDIVPQLTYYNANDCEMEDWMVSRRYADKCEFLYKVTPGRLIRQCDWDLEPRYMQEVPGILALKEGVSIVAYNLCRGRNVGHLLTDDNILLTRFGSMMLKETCLPGEMEGPENNHMAFRKLHDWYFGECGHTGLLARSMGEQLTDQVLPPELIDIRRLLKHADLVDKRQITNHTAQMLREERTEQIWDMSHFLRNRNVYILTVPPGSSYTASAKSIHVALGKLVPGGVKGIHPMMDHWVNHSRFLGKQIILSQGAEFTVDVIGDDEENGRLLVAVVRFSIEHPGGPNIARFKKKMANSYSNEHELDQIVPIPGYYTVNEVAEMRDFKLPLFGCTGLEAFLKCNLGKHAGIPTSAKTCHLRWNDLDEINSPQIFSR